MTYKFEAEVRRALSVRDAKSPVVYEDDGNGNYRIEIEAVSKARRMGATGLDLAPPIRTPLRQAEPRDMTAGEIATEMGTATAGAATGIASGAVGLPGDFAALLYGGYKALFPNQDETRGQAFVNAVETVSNAAGTEAALNLINSVIPVESMTPELRDAFEQSQTAGTFVGLGKAGKAATAGVKEFIKEAPARVAARQADTGVTLGAGVDPTPMIDEAIAKFTAPKENKPGIIAFHGSGADFDEFKLEKIGTGEGAQAYGYGLYFTDSEDIAKFYRDSVGGANVLKRAENIKIATPDGGQETAANFSGFRNKFANYYGDNAALFADRYLGQFTIEPDASEDVLIQRAIDLMNAINESDKIPNNPKEIISKITLPDRGKTYKVGLEPKPEDMLDFDLPLSQQPNAIQEKAKSVLNLLYPNVENPALSMKGRDLIDQLKQRVDVSIRSEMTQQRFIVDNKIDPALADKNRDAIDRLVLSKVQQGANLNTQNADKISSEIMQEFGIPGIKYRAAGSRGAGVDDAAAERNYVIFDDKMIKILEKYGIVGPVSIAAMNAGGSDESEAM